MFDAVAVSQEFLSTSGGEMARSLLIRWKLPVVDFIRVIYDLLRPLCDELQGVSRAYTARELCGEEVWQRWGVGPRRAAGMCIVYLAKPEGCLCSRYRLSV